VPSFVPLYCRPSIRTPHYCPPADRPSPKSPRPKISKSPFSCSAGLPTSPDLFRAHIMSPAPVQVNSSSKLPSPSFNAGARPYRSHKVRACDLCRKRKSRCTVDIPGQSCLLCRVQGADCHYQEEGNMEASILSAPDSKSWPAPLAVDAAPGQKRKRSPEGLARVSQNGPPRQPLNGPSPHGTNSSSGRRGSDPRRRDMDDPQNESVLIVGPMVAEDAQVIEKHMPPERTRLSEEPKSHPYNIYSSDPRKPVLYTTISRRRKGMRKGTPPGENQKEVLEQILGPFKHDLVRLYVGVVQPPFFTLLILLENFLASLTVSMSLFLSSTAKPFGSHTSLKICTILQLHSYAKYIPCPLYIGNTRRSLRVIQSLTFDTRST
jgi:hypothetical protein